MHGCTGDGAYRADLTLPGSDTVDALETDRSLA